MSNRFNVAAGAMLPYQVECTGVRGEDAAGCWAPGSRTGLKNERRDQPGNQGDRKEVNSR